LKLLIIQTAFVGDVVLCTPLIQAAKTRLHADYTGLVVRPETSGLLCHNPYVDEVIAYDKKGTQKGPLALWRLARTLRSQSYDAALIPHRSFRSALLGFLAGIPARIGFDRCAGKGLLTKQIPYREIHEVERNLSLLTPWEKVAANTSAKTDIAGSVDTAETTVTEEEFIVTSDTCGIKPALYPNDSDRKVIDRFMQKHGIDREDKLI